MRNHLYWELNNCENDAATQRQMLDSSVEHFQNKHDNCTESSACRACDYVPSFTIVKDPAAMEMLQNFNRSMMVCKQANSYILNHSTYYVESYNNTALIYLNKRIHYKKLMYELEVT